VALRLGTRRPGLILAGHTHGGQVRLPLVGALVTRSRLPRLLAMGLHSYRGVPLFVSRGIGYSGLNLWLHCPAEVALLTLRATAAGARAASWGGPNLQPLLTDASAQALAMGT
jgi:predicted MPP superfamily phosphohydrolase